MSISHSSAIPGSADPGSMGAGAHYPDVDPSLTTALILDPTGPGYRLDSKSPAPHPPPNPKSRILAPNVPGTPKITFLVAVS